MKMVLSREEVILVNRMAMTVERVYHWKAFTEPETRFVHRLRKFIEDTDPSKKSGQQGSCEHPEDAQVEVYDDEGNEDGIYCMVCSEKIAELPEPYDPDRDPPHPDHSGFVGVDR